MAITILLHGGAGRIAEERRDAYVRGLEQARDLGFEKLERGASAIDVVLAAVVSMEDDEMAFNAGVGSALNRDGEVECDAAVMAGHNRSAGAVAAVRTLKNPVLAANRVREASPHVLIVGEGAAPFGERVANEHFITPRQLERWRRWREKGGNPIGSATVGAVALDTAGHLAAATSTGGVIGKLPGRVGDSPLIGAGTYADRHVAVSCTGQGEAFVRAVAAKSLAMLLEHGSSLQEAAKRVLAEVRALGGDGGLIALDASGRVCAAYNAPQLAYAWRNESAQEATVGLTPGVVVR